MGAVFGGVDDGHHLGHDSVGDGPDGDVRRGGVVLCVGARGEGFFLFRGGGQGVVKMSVSFGEGSRSSECIDTQCEEEGEERDDEEGIHPRWTGARETAYRLSN